MFGGKSRILNVSKENIEGNPNRMLGPLSINRNRDITSMNIGEKGDGDWLVVIPTKAIMEKWLFVNEYVIEEDNGNNGEVKNDEEIDEREVDDYE